MMHMTSRLHRLRRGNYVSEFEQFLNAYLARHPNVEGDQHSGWYLLWDQHVDLGELDKERKDAVPLKPYGE
jgi:hypothetical protein